MFQREDKQEGVPVPAPHCLPLGPGKAFAQNWEDCPREAEREALHEWRTHESAVRVLGKQEGGVTGTWLGHLETHVATAAHT